MIHIICEIEGVHQATLREIAAIYEPFCDTDLRVVVQAYDGGMSASADYACSNGRKQSDKNREIRGLSFIGTIDRAITPVGQYDRCATAEQISAHTRNGLERGRDG